MFARAFATCGRLLGLGGDSPDDQEERRAFGRASCDISTTIKLAGRQHGDPIAGRVKNISRNGACLLAPVAIDPGELISVSLPLIQDEDTCEALACVVRCDKKNDKEWELGCTFASRLGIEDLARFDPPEHKPSQTDQRNWLRFECAAEVTYQIVRTPCPTSWSPALLHNISGGGIALQVTEELHVGDLLSLELRRDGQVVLSALASVVRTSHDHEGQTLVGCNFMRELPEECIARVVS